MNSPLRRSLIPRLPHQKRTLSAFRRAFGAWAPVVASVLVITLGLFALPGVLAVDLALDDARRPQPDFPITVYPNEKEIIVDPAVEELLSTAPEGTLAGAVGFLEEGYTRVAVWVSQIPWYRQIAGIDTLFVTIRPGYREEEVAAAFGRQLGWSQAERGAFLEAVEAKDPQLSDGQFAPGTYFVSVSKPEDVANMTQERFAEQILSRYSTSTNEVVPIEDAITIASLIEREAGGWDDMRLISGIIWNRLFINMNLQIDATLQYSKADNAGGEGGWWPTPRPADKNIRHAYNTYRGPGLPPGPIATPSVAAVVAALNPTKTDCIFYFHDQYGRFHCSPTYEGHVALLKKHYGQGR